MTDQDILCGFLNGDKQAVETVMRWIKSVVANSAWHGSIWQDDVVADALYRTLREFRSGKFEHRSTLHTYVRGITHNAIIDWLRRERRREDIARNFWPEPVDYYTAENAYEDARQREIFNEIVAQLEDRCRRIWDMVFRERLDYKSVAEREGGTPGAVKLWMFRCKERAIKLARDWDRSKRRVKAGDDN